MNIIGIWNKQNIPGEHEISWPFGTLDLDISNNVTVIENESTKLIYEGIIFDQTLNELANNQTALDNAYGSYSYVKINKNEREIIIATDKLGFSPLYYSLQGEVLVFGTSLTHVKYKIKKASPDYEAWDEILNLDFKSIIGDKTTIKEIKRLDPGMRIHIRNGKVTFKTFWSPEVPERIDKESYIRQNNELLAEALELTRNTQIPKIVLLSGGEDSRRIGVTANAIGLPIVFATQEGIHIGGVDKDVTIAQKVAEHLKILITRYKLPSEETSYNDALYRDYWLGFETSQHEWILPLIRNLSEISLVYDGIAGDVTVNSHFFRKYPPGDDNYLDIDGMVKTICGNTSMFQFDTKKLGSSLYERVRDQLQKLPNCPARRSYYYLFNHVRRNGALFSQLFNLKGHKTCNPYLYYPLFMQSLSLDPKYRLDARYQMECAVRLNPGIAPIPSTSRFKNDLSNEYLIDFSNEARKKKSLFIKMVHLRPPVKRLFPSMRKHLRIFELARLLRIHRISSRLNWRAFPLSRMSDYFDWLEDSNQPSFPVSAEEPLFLKERFIV